MLAHQLPSPLPPFSDFWNTLDAVFAWLAGEVSVPAPRVSNEGTSIPSGFPKGDHLLA